MSNTKSDPFTDHEYDGIREYDNPTPDWWVAIFIITELLPSSISPITTPASPIDPYTIPVNQALIANQQKLFAGDRRPGF